MVKEAKENEEADTKRKEEVDLRNDVDQLIFQTDKTLKDLEGKVSEDEIKKAKDAEEELKKAQQDNDLEAMKTKRDALSKIVQDLTVKLYEQAQKDQAAKGGDANAAGGNADQSNSGDKGDDDTINGQYKDVNDKK
jgi:molecular chaperone DnaK